MNSNSKNEMNIRISLCNVRRVNEMLDISLEIVPKKTHYSQPRSRVNSISKTEMNIRISLCNVRRVNGMLDISLEIVPKKTH